MSIPADVSALVERDMEIWYLSNTKQVAPPDASQAASQAASQNAAQERRELRDRFAMAALSGLLSGTTAREITDAMCKTVWEIADAMLKARGDD